MYGVDTDYYGVFVAHNYVFYRIETKAIRIINIYNEREDFMKDLLHFSSIDERNQSATGMTSTVITARDNSLITLAGIDQIICIAEGKSTQSVSQSQNKSV